MTSFKNFSSVLLSACFSFLIVLQLSCVPPKADELFPAGVAQSCKDNVMNRDEYRVDCGGSSCSPCPSSGEAVYVEVDSTWIADSVKSQARFWTAQHVVVNHSGDDIEIIAVDTFKIGDPEFMSLTFNIKKTYVRGIYEIEIAAPNEKFVNIPPSGPGGSVTLERGVITITNVDKVNKLISGQFEYISKPHPDDLYRIGFYGGTFTDIPLEKPQ